jgi:hypothetical protein
MRCHSVGSGTVNRIQPAMQSVTRSFSAAHTMLWIRVYDDAGNVIETHEHKGDFKEP